MATPESLQGAAQTIEVLSEGWPKRLTTFLLKLDLVLAQSHSMESYCQVILQAIDAVAITETAYKAITHGIHSLASKNLAKLACNCLDSLITKRLLPIELGDWLDQTFVTRLYVTVHIGSALDEDAVSGIRHLLDAIAKEIPRTFSPRTTLAAQLFLWKASETLYSQENYRLSSAWCRLALHMVFDRSGESNLAKICR